MGIGTSFWVSSGCHLWGTLEVLEFPGSPTVHRILLVECFHVLATPRLVAGALHVLRCPLGGDALAGSTDGDNFRFLGTGLSEYLRDGDFIPLAAPSTELSDFPGCSPCGYGQHTGAKVSAEALGEHHTH